jgi:mono/diheme cytochrome c family protein
MTSTYRIVLAAAFAAVALASAACHPEDTSSGDSGPERDASPLPCDVAQVLAANCQTCHGEEPSFGAPMALVSAGDLHAPAHSDPSRQVFELISGRVHAEHQPMPPPPNARLGDAQTATLDAWLEQGAPAGTDEACPGVVPGVAQTGATCTPDTSIAPTSAWTMPAGPDIYACYRFTPPPGRSVTAFLPRIDNAAIVHHMVLFIAGDEKIGTDPEGPCEAEMSALWRMVYGWGPGGPALSMPQGVGLTLEPHEHYVMQIHYSNPLGLEDATDTSGVDLCTSDEPPLHEADVMAFGTLDFTIPPHQTMSVDCEFEIPEMLGTFHAIASLPHMHALGTSIANTVEKGGSTTAPPVDIGSVPSWDFAVQEWKTFSATLTPGDVVRTRCAWNNTTDLPVEQGEYSADEMCLDFVLYYPKVEDLLSWAIPAHGSACTQASQ